jgi:ribonuclease E
VAVLPGRDTLQPLATVSGLVRSAASARAEVFTPATAPAAVESSGRRRRGGRGGRGSEAPEIGAYGEFGAAPTFETAPVERAERSERPERSERGGDNSLRRTDHELVAVPMEPQQELVYGWLGLSPALLLDSVPSGDNVLVRVVRPGADPESVLEEARQQLAAVGSRRRRRGRGGSEGRGEANGDSGSDRGGESSAFPAANGWGDQGLADGRDSMPVVEITPLPIEIPSSLPVAEVLTVEVPARRRRGASRTTTSAIAEVPLLTSPEAAPALVAAADEEPADDAGEPRRRRRRSSASD